MQLTLIDYKSLSFITYNNHNQRWTTLAAISFDTWRRSLVSTRIQMINSTRYMIVIPYPRQIRSLLLSLTQLDILPSQSLPLLLQLYLKHWSWLGNVGWLWNNDETSSLGSTLDFEWREGTYFFDIGIRCCKSIQYQLYPSRSHWTRYRYTFANTTCYSIPNLAITNRW